MRGSRASTWCTPRAGVRLLTASNEDEGKRIIDKYSDWITDDRRMDLASEDAVYMHPLPADRNIEVTDEVIEGPRSIVYDQERTLCSGHDTSTRHVRPDRQEGPGDRR